MYLYVRNFGDMPIRTRTKDSHQPDLGMGVHAHKPVARKTTSFWFHNKAFLHARPKKRSARKLAIGEIWSRDMSPKFLTCKSAMIYTDLHRVYIAMAAGDHQIRQNSPMCGNKLTTNQPTNQPTNQLAAVELLFSKIPLLLVELVCLNNISWKDLYITRGYMSILKCLFLKPKSFTSFT